MKAYELLFFVAPNTDEETLINFHADPQQIAELDRVLRINDAVKRHMVVCRSDRD